MYKYLRVGENHSGLGLPTYVLVYYKPVVNKNLRNNAKVWCIKKFSINIIVEKFSLIKAVNDGVETAVLAAGDLTDITVAIT